LSPGEAGRAAESHQGLYQSQCTEAPHVHSRDGSDNQASIPRAVQYLQYKRLFADKNGETGGM
jgi:hypothetical protein